MPGAPNNDLNPSRQGRPADASGRKRRYTGLQRQPDPGGGARAFREDHDLPFFAERAIGLAQQLAKRRRATAPVHRDHATKGQQRAEQRDPQQFLLHHVAATRQQGEPDDGIERRLVIGGDQSGVRTCQPFEAYTWRRMPQITLAAPTMIRAHIRATLSTRSGATRRTNMPGTSAIMKVVVKKNTLNRVERNECHPPWPPCTANGSRTGSTVVSPRAEERYLMYSSAISQSRRGPALCGRRPDRDRIQGRVR